MLTFSKGRIGLFKKDTMKKEIEFLCGCVIPWETRKRYCNKEKGVRNEIVCKTHHERVKTCIFYCECGRQVIVKNLSALAVILRCKDCAKTSLKKRAQKSFKSATQRRKFIFKCGCKFIRPELPKRVYYDRMKCPDCGEPLAYIAIVCKGCGKEFHNLNNRAYANCPDCREKIKDRDEYDQKEEAIVDVEQALEKEHSKCKHRSECLVKHIMKKKLPCDNCPDYSVAELDILDFASVKDSFSRTKIRSHQEQWRGDRL